MLLGQVEPLKPPEGAPPLYNRLEEWGGGRVHICYFSRMTMTKKWKEKEEEVVGVVEKEGEEDEEEEEEE